MKTMAKKRTAAKPMRARGMTFCTLAGSGGGTLGLRTERGILDAAAASRLYRIAAPTDIHAVIEHVQREVAAQKGVQLKTEVVYLGEW